jgi:hypothetical protein
VLRLRFGQAASAVVPGGDVLPPTPVDSAAGSSDVSAPAEEPAAEPTLEPAPAGEATPESPSLFSPDSAFPPEPASAEEPFSPGLGGDGLGATGDPSVAADVGASPPEVALVTPPPPRPNLRARRLASTSVVKAVDGVYAAVGWAALAVLGLSLIWRQGARKWTS